MISTKNLRVWVCGVLMVSLIDWFNYCGGVWLDLRLSLSFSLSPLRPNILNIPLRRSSLLLLLLLTPDTEEIDWASLSLELSAEAREKLIESGCNETGRLGSKRALPQPENKEQMLLKTKFKMYKKIMKQNKGYKPSIEKYWKQLHGVNYGVLLN